MHVENIINSATVIYVCIDVSPARVHLLALHMLISTPKTVSRMSFLQTRIHLHYPQIMFDKRSLSETERPVNPANQKLPLK